MALERSGYKTSLSQAAIIGRHDQRQAKTREVIQTAALGRGLACGDKKEHRADTGRPKPLGEHKQGSGADSARYHQSPRGREAALTRNRPCVAQRYQRFDFATLLQTRQRLGSSPQNLI
jgi:hypothetical protein